MLPIVAEMNILLKKKITVKIPDFVEIFCMYKPRVHYHSYAFEFNIVA